MSDLFLSDDEGSPPPATQAKKRPDVDYGAEAAAEAKQFDPQINEFLSFCMDI
jgi:hypothetical protein